MKKLLLTIVLSAVAAVATAATNTPTQADDLALAARAERAALDAAQGSTQALKMQALQLQLQARILVQLHCLNRLGSCDNLTAPAVK